MKSEHPTRPHVTPQSTLACYRARCDVKRSEQLAGAALDVWSGSKREGACLSSACIHFRIGHNRPINTLNSVDNQCPSLQCTSRDSYDMSSGQ